MRPVCSINLALLMLLALTLAGTASAQCGMGVPSAGNPNCVPPDVLHSQGIQQPHTQEPVQPTVVIRREWKDRWGAMILDHSRPVTGFSSGAKSKEEAERLAVNDCRANGGLDCKDIGFYHNQCASMIAIKGGGVHMAYGPTVEKAEDHGLSMCADRGETCRVLHSDCSHAELVEVSRSIR